MATATVKLYFGTDAHRWDLTPNKFFVIDNIEEYLATYTPTTISNFQYQKCSLELAINCDLSQVYSEPLYKNGIKYVSITNSDATKIYYYYVKKAEWRGKQTVKLYLVMDVANTFRSGTDFDFTEKTKIIREHKNRIKKITNGKEVYYAFADMEAIASEVGDIGTYAEINYTAYESDPVSEAQAEAYQEYGITGYELSVYDDTKQRQLTSDEYNPELVDLVLSLNEGDYPECSFKLRVAPEIYGDTLYIDFQPYYVKDESNLERIVDLQSEGLSPVLYKKNETLIERESLINCDWFLLYRNQNDPTEALTNPVECYLIPSDEIAVNMGSIQSGGRINPSNLEVGKYYYIPLQYHQTRTITLSNGVVLAASGSIPFSTNPLVIVEKVDEDTLMVYSTEFVDVQSGQNEIRVKDTYYCSYFNIDTLPCSYKIYDNFTTLDAAEFPSVDFNSSWTTEGTSPKLLDSIEKLDRTDAKNIKLIKLPYVPYDFKIENDKLILTDTDFEHVSLTQSSGGIIEVLRLTNLNVKFNYDFKIGSSPLSVLRLNKEVPAADDLRDDAFESKIYHSDYYQPKFVYDSFNYVFQIERMDLNFFEQLLTPFNMKLKYVVSSTINSRFMFQFVDYFSNVAKEDYNNVMTVARNNEIVLYNVPYINYIRTGFNYDVKNKQTQAASTWASVGLGGLTTAAALLFPTVPLKVAGIIASLVSTTVSVKNAVVSQIQAERNIDEKMLNAKNQSTSISGSDDVDLMSVYTENRAKLCFYECNDVIKNLLLDLFFYTGYVSNRMGLPNTHTRRNFDYLEADIIITDYVNMSDEIMNELVGLYKNGLTFIHKVSGRTKPWDLEQKYENIELSVLS